jgi:3-methyladenine DNA glycosylase/8-oxoguanine DNA glycosylase
VSAWSIEIPLVGAGGEPVDLARTIHSHGLVELPPQEIDPVRPSLTVTLLDGRRARTLTIGPGRKGRLRIDADSPAERLVPVVRHMLRLDEDMSAFYALVAADPDLSWSAVGAGRMIRSPSVFEDVVKTICTTNCAWSATERMVGALVANLGVAARDGRRTFPTAEAMAEADESFYKDVVRAGYRGPYFRTLAADAAEGRLDLEELNDPELPDDEVAARLLALPGVGPYATAHMMMLLGRYSRLILDSWTRPKYARVNGRTAGDRTIERRFRRYRQYAGLAFWLYLTRDWVDEAAGIK